MDVVCLLIDTHWVIGALNCYNYWPLATVSGQVREKSYSSNAPFVWYHNYDNTVQLRQLTLINCANEHAI
jgi:hypothetical protein